MSEKFNNNSPAEAIPSSTLDVELGPANDLFATEFELAMDRLSEPETSDNSETEVGRESKLAGAIDNVAGNLADFVEKTHKNRLDLQEEVSASLEKKGEAIKKGAKSAGQGALGFFKKLGAIGAAVGTTTLGAAIIGAETVGKKAGEVKDRAAEKADEVASSVKESYEKGKMNRSHAEAIRMDKAMDRQSQREMNEMHKEALQTNKAIDRRAAREEAKQEALLRKQEHQEKQRIKQIDAEARKDERIKNKLIMESIRKNNAAARKAARHEKVENIKGSIVDKKDAVAGGMNRISGSALNFLKRAKSAGEAAMEDWKNYEKEDADHKTSL